MPNAGSTGAELKAPRAPSPLTSPQRLRHGWGCRAQSPAAGSSARHALLTQRPSSWGEWAPPPLPSSWPGPGTHAPRGFHLKGATSWAHPRFSEGSLTQPQRCFGALDRCYWGPPDRSGWEFFPPFQPGLPGAQALSSVLQESPRGSGAPLGGPGGCPHP